ncbi:transmembrane protein 272-like [Bufo gargarizans]|uniref:transmembrane protein 272-like n=1 Tax=Bufo gargarizans TaxID=30331 RepID=UPI001CF52DAF|nr:transmembrane protein 272-like [Bufo gargarizans]
MESSCSLCLQVITFIAWFGLGIAMIVMGAIYKDECPIQPSIPIFLLVAGVTHLVFIILLFLRRVLETCSIVLEALIGMFSFAWFITGSVWVFSLYSKNIDSSQCDQNLYFFAFGFLIFQYVVIGLSLIVPCFGCSVRSFFYER